MKKGKVIRLAGFAGALGLSAVLVTTAVQGTGAYFTDSHDGTMTISSGHLKLHGVGSPTLNYNGLMPGKNVTKDLAYTVDVSSDTADVWMVFDQTDSGYLDFTGADGMGRYGYFKVSDSNGGRAFRSGTLRYADSTLTRQPSDCSVDSFGRGGSDWIATDHTTAVNVSGFCGVPGAIRLASDLSDGATGTISVTIGLNGYMQTQQDQTEPTVPFHIVGTQHNVLPTTKSWPN